MRYALVIIMLAMASYGAVKEVRFALPEHDETPTLAERIEAKKQFEAAKAKRITDAMIVQAIEAVVADTRTNITAVAELTDVEVAGLYLAQMKKPVGELVENAPTNTVEYAIGAGIRDDLLNTTTGE